MQGLDLDVFKEIPGYKAILKAVLKSQIKALVEQLAKQTGEESVLLSACVEEGTLSHLGSDFGMGFLEGHDDIKVQFLGFCLKRYQLKKQTNLYPEKPTRRRGPAPAHKRPRLGTALSNTHYQLPHPVSLTKVKTPSQTSTPKQHLQQTQFYQQQQLQQNLHSGFQQNPQNEKSLFQSNIPVSEHSSINPYNTIESPQDLSKTAEFAPIKTFDTKIDQSEASNLVMIKSEPITEDQLDLDSKNSIKDNIMNAEDNQMMDKHLSNPNYSQQGTNLSMNESGNAGYENQPSKRHSRKSRNPARKVKPVIHSPQEDPDVENGNQSEDVTFDPEDVKLNSPDASNSMPHDYNEAHSAVNSPNVLDLAENNDMDGNGTVDAGNFTKNNDSASFKSTEIGGNSSSIDVYPSTPSNSYGPLHCEFCNKSFKNSRNLKTHVFGHTGVRPFPCPFCPKRFMQKNVLEQHLCIHTGLKQFTCRTCHKSFSQRASLYRHTKLHALKQS